MMKSKKLTVAIAVIVILAMAQTGFYAYMTAVRDNGNKKVKDAPAATEQVFGDTAASDQIIKAVKQPKKAVDISKVKLSADIENTISKLDSKNGKKYVQKYKTMLAELKVPDKFKGEIEKSLKKGYNTPEVLIAYQYLYENYGQVSDLEKLLAKKKSGKQWSAIFREYTAASKPFVPSNFKQGYIESLIEKYHFTPDDIMIADRISQKGIKTFDELVEMKKQGKTWEQINTELGILNTEEKLPRLALTSGQVKKLMQDTKLSEQQVVNALVMAEKLDKDDTEVLDMVKAGEKDDDIYAAGFDEKYR